MEGKRQEVCWCMVVCSGDLNVNWGNGGARAGLLLQASLYNKSVGSQTSFYLSFYPVVAL